MVSTTAQAFLGMTLGCARCHNHKFEPLSQLDYYRMVAIFDPLQRPPSFLQPIWTLQVCRLQSGENGAFRLRSPCYPAAE